MKKTLLICFLCVINAIVCADTPCKVYARSGNVFVKVFRTSQWLPVQENQEISILDSVSIGQEGSLSIIDPLGNIYNSISKGKKRVLNIISEVKEQQSKMLSAINGLMIDEFKSTRKKPSQIAGLGGYTNRGMIEMKDLVKTWAWLAQQACNDKLQNTDSELVLKRYDTPDGTFFEIQNTSDKAYYVNVLYVDRQTKKVNLCYIIKQEDSEDAYIGLPSGKTIRIEEMKFRIDESKDIFILVGTEDEYIPEVIQSALQCEDVEQAEPLYAEYTYYKL